MVNESAIDSYHAIALGDRANESVIHSFVDHVIATAHDGMTNENANDSLLDVSRETLIIRYGMVNVMAMSDDATAQNETRSLASRHRQFLPHVF
jgi:hypothetical protein